MKVTENTKAILKHRRADREMQNQGYEHCKEPIWQLHRGGRQNDRIVDVQIDMTGKGIWIKTEKANP